MNDTKFVNVNLTGLKLDKASIMGAKWIKISGV